ncbi:DUF1330 domain-containing protein [Streptomyces sp. NPDC037389]|uniref:DUF1330 domain-containing protein n=1 Tax=Streptomyces sp. NPDC037389 TaxID=3155369 RepID=UPI0033C7E1B6
MTVYAIAQLSIHDRPRYESYAARFASVLTRYGGRLLAADERPRVVEGQWDRDKVVLLAFPDHDAFTAWADSPEYQEISRDRLAAAGGPVLLVRGVT